MQNPMDTVASFIVGLIFGLGLVIGGMTDPSKVIGFLDISGSWDPSLAFVMGGALLVGVIAGYLPARPAASLDPVEALRYE